MKKTALTLTLCLLAGLCAGCAGRDAPDPAASGGPLRLEALALELDRDALPAGADDASAVQEALRALPKALRAALSDNGVEVGRVSVSVGASHAATAQALAEGGIDLAILPETVFAEYGGGALPLLARTMDQPSVDSADPADWNGGAVTMDGPQSAGGRYLIVAGPSAYGRQLAERAGADSPLTWTELDNARWALPETMDGKAAEGLWTVDRWLAERCNGNTLSSLSAPAYVQTPLNALANQEADLAVIFADQRAGGWAEEAGDIWENTAVVGVTDRYYETVLAVRPGDGALSGPEFQTALQAALARLCEDAVFPWFGPFSPVSPDRGNAG